MSKHEETKTLAQIISKAFCGILILTCIIVYLILGVTIGYWHPGWLIVVCGAIACGIIGIVGELISNVKEYRKEKQKKDE
ncbi:MAG: hypothetical protein ACI4R8_02855 [Candidatus Caccovivens sp.]